MRNMKMEIVTLLMTILAMASAKHNYGRGKEYGRLNAFLQSRQRAGRTRNQGNSRQDSNLIQGNAQQQARWKGHDALQNRHHTQNEQAAEKQASTANENFGTYNTNMGDTEHRTRGEAAGRHYKLKDDAGYQQNLVTGAQGANKANAKKTAFSKGDGHDDVISYVFNKTFDKASSENGGYKEENGRNLKKLNLVDERENDRRLVQGDTKVSRASSDQQKASNAQDWQSSTAQSQSQDKKTGVASRREDTSGESSDDKAVDYNRKKSRQQELEQGRDEAVRLAKELARKATGHKNEAVSAAGASRSVADARYYGGKRIAADPSAVGKHKVVSGDAAQAAAAVSGDTAQQEGSRGLFKSDFNEDISQHEKANDLSSAKALSATEDSNDYQGNKNKLALSQISGLQDRSEGHSKQSLNNAAARGFSDSNAQAAKSSSASDKVSAISQANSDMKAKKENQNKAMRDRNYIRKIQNDDSETFTQSKQFFHRKNEGGKNNEKLKYDRQSNDRNYGALDEADLSKQNQFHNLHENGKVSGQARYLEDLTDRDSNTHHVKSVNQSTEKGSDNRHAQSAGQAQSAVSGHSQDLEKSSLDDSQSQSSNNRHSLQNQTQSQDNAASVSKDNAQLRTADVESVSPTDGKPLGDISSNDFIGTSLLSGPSESKEHAIPDVIVAINPIHPPTKVEPPQQRRPIPQLPDVQPVKTFQRPKHNKAEVSYDTGRSSDQTRSDRPFFSQFGPMSLFQGPRDTRFNPVQKSTPQARFSLQPFKTRPSVSSGFRRGMFANSNMLSRFARDSYDR